MVLEDDGSVQSLIRLILRSNGWNATIVSDVREAVDAILARKNDFSRYLFDLKTPIFGFDKEHPSFTAGLLLREYLMEEWRTPGKDIVLMTGGLSRTDEAACELYGFDKNLIIEKGLAMEFRKQIMELFAQK